MLVLGICGWNLMRKRNVDVFGRSARVALPITLVTVIATLGFGHGQALLMDTQQPMKMAAAEAL